MAARRRREGIVGLRAGPPAAQLQQQRFGVRQQRGDVDARRDREQHVTGTNAFALAVSLRVLRMQSPARLLRRLGHAQLPLEQRLDREHCRFARHGVFVDRVLGSEQAGTLRRLAQQLGARSLAQRLAVEPLAGPMQRLAVHARDGARALVALARCGLAVALRGPARTGPVAAPRHRAHIPVPRRVGWGAASGSGMRRLRTTWYGRNA